MIALGSDHVGLPLKLSVAEFLRDQGQEFRDLGCFSDDRVDYPHYGELVARAVARGEYESGLLFCGTGVGMSITANKVAGIRAVVCSEPYSAKLSRRHNDTNVLALGTRVVGIDLARMIVEAWLTTTFEGGRHAVRVRQIEQIEQRNVKMAMGVPIPEQGAIGCGTET
jgi:ribose 5-phosphate isomerase B